MSSDPMRKAVQALRRPSAEARPPGTDEAACHRRAEVVPGSSRTGAGPPARRSGASSASRHQHNAGRPHQRLADAHLRSLPTTGSSCSSHARIPVSATASAMAAAESSRRRISRAAAGP